MTIEEYRAAIFKHCSMQRMRTALLPSLLRKPKRHSTVLPMTNCRMESFGIHQKTWLKSYSKDKNTSKYSVKKRIMEFMIRFFHFIRFILIAANAIEL